MSDYGAYVAWDEAQKSTFFTRYLEKHRTPQKLISPFRAACEEIDQYWPVQFRARAWIGAVRGILEHPYVGEEVMFGEALDELNRLRKEVA